MFKVFVVLLLVMFLKILGVRMVVVVNIVILVFFKIILVSVDVFYGNSDVGEFVFVVYLCLVVLCMFVKYVVGFILFFFGDIIKVALYLVMVL